LVASSLYILYHYVFGDFSDNIVIILSFILNVVLLWYVILKLWRKVDFVGSCEWIVHKGNQWLSRQPFLKRKNRSKEDDHEELYLLYHENYIILNQ
ncbi:MAG: hypothetical protein ACTSYU_11400, partial [Promethearchaeota archaeon]